jgi:hypothetical protein
MGCGGKTIFSFNCVFTVFNSTLIEKKDAFTVHGSVISQIKNTNNGIDKGWQNNGLGEYDSYGNNSHA